MTPVNDLDLSGDFRVHPFAELLVEILQAKLTGAMRMSVQSKKNIVYFRDGAVVFAVSNARELSLFVRLLNSHAVTQADLKRVGNFTNDIDLASNLCAKGVLTAEAAENAFVSQIGQIIIDALGSPTGKWTFSPMARLRSDVYYEIEIYQLLMDYARCLPAETVIQRFRSVEEKFTRSIDVQHEGYLQPQEACVMDLFADTPLNFAQLRDKLNMAEAAIAQSLYTLWLGGSLVRLGWNKAFSETRIADIKKTRYSKVKEALPLASFDAKSSVNIPTATTPGTDNELPAEPKLPEKIAEPEVSLDDWLTLAETAPTYYDLFDLEKGADTGAVKAAYFMLAKQFHPDRFHRETGSRLRRIQVAFTTLAQAYETLKDSESRQSYDYKIRKELEAREKRYAEGVTDSAAGMQSERSLESFEQGLNYLNEEEFKIAALHLARAVHYSPINALYRAYYGKALSFDEGQRHKAEAELQAAAKLEPENAKIRLMLAGFFIEHNLKKRAEGELRRFLEIAPDNKEARDLLNSLI